MWVRRAIPASRFVMAVRLRSNARSLRGRKGNVIHFDGVNVAGG